MGHPRLVKLNKQPRPTTMLQPTYLQPINYLTFLITYVNSVKKCKTNLIVIFLTL